MDSIRMNMVIAVPQLFYDLIARVFPGFLFLFLIWSLPNVSTDGIWLVNVLPEIPDNFWGSLYFGIAYFVLSYYVGWILGHLSGISPLNKYGVDYKISLHPEDKSPNSTPLKVKYQKIRLANENVGFRIVKLRAEAKMLEASRTEMCLVAALMMAIFIYKYLFDCLDYKQLINQSLLFLTPVIIAIIFQRSIADAVERYIGNIEAHYDLMFRGDDALDYHPLVIG
jgi:hypothetical protein